MNDYVDFGRQKLPYTFRIVIWTLFSFLLLAYASSDGQKPTILYITLVSASGIIFGLAFYGLISLVRDYKKHQTIDGMLNEIKQTYKDANK
jgi:hypothetical protein